MQIYRMVTAVALIFGVIAFAHFVSDDATPQRSSSAETTWESAEVTSPSGVDRKAVIAKIKATHSQNDKDPAVLDSRSQSEIMREAGRELSRDEAIKRFRSARNFWAADLTLTEESRMERLELLAGALFGEGSEVPEETQEDLDEQKRLRAIYANFNQDLALINANAEMKLDDRRSRIEALVRKALQETGS
jgi:hypothetical protein